MNKKFLYKNKYYVYLHIDPRTSQPFYVGKGTGGRAWIKNSRSNAHLHLFKELKDIGLSPIIDIVAVFETEKEALKKEKEIIENLSYSGVRLINKNKGGGGHPGGFSHPKFGVKTSQETKEKISLALKGKPRPDISEINKNRMKGNSIRKDKKMSEKSKLAISESLKGNQRRSEKIICENNGKIYNSVKEAWTELKLDERSVFRVLKGEYSHTKGYKFKYL